MKMLCSGISCPKLSVGYHMQRRKNRWYHLRNDHTIIFNLYRMNCDVYVCIYFVKSFGAKLRDRMQRQHRNNIPCDFHTRKWKHVLIRDRQYCIGNKRYYCVAKSVCILFRVSSLYGMQVGDLVRHKTIYPISTCIKK